MIRVLSGLVKVTVLIGYRVDTGAGGVYWCCWCCPAGDWCCCVCTAGGWCGVGAWCGGVGAWCGDDTPSSDGSVVNFTRMLVLGNRNVQLKF